MVIWVLIAGVILNSLMAIGNLRNKDYPHSFIWFCYALSQCGFIWYELSKESK